MHFARPSGSISRRQLSVFLAGTLCAGAAVAQSESGFPSKTVRLVVPFPAGGAGDQSGRELAKGLQSLWGQTVVVDNLVGAAGSIGADAVVRSVADGHTLVYLPAGVPTVLPFLREKMSFDPLVDLLPIAMTTSFPNVLVVPAQSPYKSFKDLIATAKAKPGAIDYASSGRGESHHMLMEYLMAATGTKFNEIPYKGGAPALLAVAAGEVQVAWIAVATAGPFLKSGRLMALAVNMPSRVSQFPEVPSVDELGYPELSQQQSTWMGVMGPAKIPTAVARKISLDIQKVVNSAGYRETMDRIGAIPRYESMEQFSAMIRNLYARNKATLAP
jgi:tripartite-type tricarboxylate transporter receptor subunit TctC